MGWDVMCARFRSLLKSLVHIEISLGIEVGGPKKTKNKSARMYVRVRYIHNK